MQVRPIREQLSANLLKNYDTNMIPVVSDERKQINAHHVISRVSLNAQKAVLDVRGKIEMVRI